MQKKRFWWRNTYGIEYISIVILSKYDSKSMWLADRKSLTFVILCFRFECDYIKDSCSRLEVHSTEMINKFLSIILYISKWVLWRWRQWLFPNINSISSWYGIFWSWELFKKLFDIQIGNVRAVGHIAMFIEYIIWWQWRWIKTPKFINEWYFLRISDDEWWLCVFRIIEIVMFILFIKSDRIILSDHSIITRCRYTYMFRIVRKFRII